MPLLKNKDFKKMFLTKQNLFLTLLLPVSFFLGIYFSNFLGMVYIFTIIIGMINVFIPISTLLFDYYDEINRLFKINNKYISAVFSFIISEPLLCNLNFGFFLTIVTIVNNYFANNIIMQSFWNIILFLYGFTTVLFYYYVFSKLFKSKFKFKSFINIIFKLFFGFIKYLLKIGLFGLYYFIGSVLYLASLLMVSAYFSDTAQIIENNLLFFGVVFLFFSLGMLIININSYFKNYLKF